MIMKFLFLLAFTLLAVNAFVASDENEDDLLMELLENENKADERDLEEELESRFAREVDQTQEDEEEEEEEGEEEELMSDPSENDEPEEMDEEEAPAEPEEAFDEEEIEEMF